MSLHLTNFHGAFASRATARAQVLLPVPGLTEVVAETPRASTAPTTEGKAPRAKRPRVDWTALQRHTFGCDVWACPCGGRRRVVAVVTNARTAEELLRNLGRWQPTPPLAAAQGPPQRELVLDA